MAENKFNQLVTSDNRANTKKDDDYQVLDTAQMYAADALTIKTGIAGIELMNNAARAVTEVILAAFHLKNVIVVCGKGNNGGDGFAAAQLLKNAGYNITVIFAGNEEDFGHLSGDAKISATQWSGETLFADSNDALDFSCADLIVDAILGAGISGAPSSCCANLIELINQSGKPVVSIDLPTGVCGDNGQIFSTAVDATMTVTFFRKKPAHLLMPGKNQCGDVLVCDIGIDESALRQAKPKLFENNPVLWLDRYPFPDAGTHKYRRGHALVLSGERYTTGAARLAAAAALRIGAGVVTLGSPAAAMDVNATHLTEIMQTKIDDETALLAMLQKNRLRSVTLGPGLGVGERTMNFVLTALTTNRGPGCAIVLDADALSSFEQTPAKLFHAIKASDNPVVMTPHAGEFFRLFDMPTISPNSKAISKVDLTKDAAAQSGAIIVYKGSDTVIAAPDGSVVVNANAPSWLATAGSGDVLAGTICGLLCQGFEVDDPTIEMPMSTIFQLTCAAVWIHAQAANLYGIGLIASDIHRTYPQVLSKLREYQKII